MWRGYFGICLPTFRYNTSVPTTKIKRNSIPFSFHFISFSFFLSFLFSALCFVSVSCYYILPLFIVRFPFLFYCSFPISLFSFLHLLFFLTYFTSCFTLAFYPTFPHFCPIFIFLTTYVIFPSLLPPSSFPLFVKWL